MGRKGSEVSPNKRYPLRSTHGDGRVLRSATNKSIMACSETPNNNAPAQPAVRKRKSGSLSESSNNSVRVLRSASKNKVDLCSESLDDSIPGTPDANKRKGARPSKAASPINSVRMLRSVSKNEDKACNETPNSSTTGKQTANRRKCVTPSNVRSPNYSLRVLRSASKNKNDTYSEPLNDNTVVQPSVKKRKTDSPLKMEAPASSARVLRSNSKRTNETFDKPLNDNAASQPVSRKRKSVTPPKAESPKHGVRVLRSASRKKDACVEPLNVSTPVQPDVKKRISGRSSKERSPKKDYLKICQRVKYILNRMNYEQSLIQAYSSEGWKGQSLEKIRPEKELERAKAEILRCKIKIREAFRNMDSLLSEGKLEESLFDSAGAIFSEDIFCAICGSKDVTLKNDIILCDGACDRGFHQNCLNPPLRTEDIPPGNEGWFCPACVCKIDCIDALNELQGSKLSVHDPWEKVFPEAASLANGSKEHDASYLPLGDSEYNDYNIAMAEGHMVKGGRSSAEVEVDDLGLPSDDSEDDDFDPTGPDSSEDQKNESHSEESDFTSDSDYFCMEIAKSSGQGEVSISPLSDVNEKTCEETELDQDVVLPVSSRRQVERLDYKKLYDEEYGEESSSSSDDEEWSGKENLEDSDTDGSVRPAKARSRRASAGYPNSQHTQSERCYGSVSGQQAEVPRSNSSNGAARRFDPIIKQKLKSHFEKDRYPSRATKESLAQELGLTFIQVDKWFASTRHSSRVAAATKGKQTENYNTGNNDDAARNHSNEKNDRASVDSIPGKESNSRVIENPTKYTNDSVSPKLMLQINLNEGNDDDVMFSQLPSCKETVVTTPTAMSKAVGPTGYMPGENQGNGDFWSTLFEQGLVTTPTTVPREVDPPGYGPGENQGYGESRNTVSEQRIFMSPAISQEVGPPGYGPGENQGNNTSWNTSSEERFYIPTTSSREACPPGYGPGGGQVNGMSRDATSEQRVDTAPSTISMKVVPPGYGPSEYQVSGSSWGASNERRVVMTPSTKPIEVGPPGYWPGGNQGNSGASWNNSCEANVFMTPTTTSSEVGPPGYWPGENKGNGASTKSPKGSSAQKSDLVDDARKKAIARELRRMKKFR